MSDYPRKWLITCERCGGTCEASKSFFSYDRITEKWQLTCDRCEKITDYDISTMRIIADDPRDMLHHLNDKLWFNPVDFVCAIARAYRQYFK